MTQPICSNSSQCGCVAPGGAKLWLHTWGGVGDSWSPQVMFWFVKSCFCVCFVCKFSFAIVYVCTFVMRARFVQHFCTCSNLRIVGVCLYKGPAHASSSDLYQKHCQHVLLSWINSTGPAGHAQSDFWRLRRIRQKRKKVMLAHTSSLRWSAGNLHSLTGLAIPSAANLYFRGNLLQQRQNHNNCNKA